MSGFIMPIETMMQEMRAQNLATLMAAIGPVAAPAASGAEGRETGNAQALAALAGAAQNEALAAQVLVPPRNGRLILAVAGRRLEIALPPELAARAADEPQLFIKGAKVLLLPQKPEPGIAGQSFRLVMPEAKPAEPAPATFRNLTPGVPQGTSLDAAPPLAQHFPAGSVGAAIEKLTGLTFPVAEAGATPKPALASAEPHAASPGALPPAQRLAPGSAPLPPELAQVALKAAMRNLPLAPALTQLFAAPAASLPPDAALLLNALKALRLDGRRAPDADGIGKAVAQSGLFLEANLARLAKEGAAPPPRDMKTLLEGTGPEAAQKSAAAHAGTPEHAAPKAGAAPANAPAEPAPQGLARLVEGAVERLKLMQLASVPDNPQVVITDDRSQPMRLTLALPIAVQGMERPETAMIGVMIEHHPAEDTAPPPEERQGDGSAEAGFPWMVRLALDLEETGPIQADIALRGQSIGITLWAERASTAKAAQGDLATLHKALTEAAFDVMRLEVKPGRPMGKALRLAPVVDQRT